MIKYLIPLFLLAPLNAISKNIIEDAGTYMTADEIEVAVQHWPPLTREEAAKDPRLRREYLNNIFKSKKLANFARSIKKEENPDLYWKLYFGVRTQLIDIYIEDYKKNLKVPKMNNVAKERFLADKDKYALVPERRASSQILVKCTRSCKNDEQKKEIAENILKDLRQGGNFEEAVDKYSEDPGSKAKKGSIELSISKNQENIIGEYITGVFSISKVGEYSEVIKSRFGYHIIRLDSIEEKSYKTFEQAKNKIIKTLEQEYIDLSLKELYKQFYFSKDAKLDNKELDKIFSPYKN